MLKQNHWKKEHAKTVLEQEIEFSITIQITQENINKKKITIDNVEWLKLRQNRGSSYWLNKKGFKLELERKIESFWEKSPVSRSLFLAMNCKAVEKVRYFIWYAIITLWVKPLDIGELILVQNYLILQKGLNCYGCTIYSEFFIVNLQIYKSLLQEKDKISKEVTSETVISDCEQRIYGLRENLNFY